ncbi:MAG: hypothetical protein ACKO2F_08745 [Cyanobacteriota bacterium]|jgi:hypothetical protein
MVTNFLQPFQHFSEWLSAFEQRLFKPANVIRFLVGRCLLMLSMLLTFWWFCRPSL